MNRRTFATLLAPSLLTGPGLLAESEAPKGKDTGLTPKDSTTRTHRDKAFGDTGGKAWRRGRVLIHVKELILPDPDTGHKNLRLRVDIESLEQVFALGNLKVRVMVYGIFNGVKTPFLRMIVNETETFTLKQRRTHTFRTSLMESGEGKPQHINHGILYRGYMVAVEDRYGDVIRTRSTNVFLEERYEELKSVKSGTNFRQV